MPKKKVAVISEKALQIAASAPQIRSAKAAERSIGLVIDIELIGRRRKVNTDQVEVDADKRAYGVHKKLFDCDELRAITQHVSLTKRYVKAKCLPHLFKKGVYLLPLELFDEVDERLKESSVEFNNLVDAFVNTYDKTVKEQKLKLRSLFDEDDYPSTARVKDEFYFGWNYKEFGVPGKLKTINPVAFKREQEKAAKEWQDIVLAGQQMLREKLTKLFDHMVQILTPTEDGKKKKFHDSSLDKINDFLDTFDVRNIGDNASLKAIADKSRKLVSGIDPEILHEDEKFRAQVHKEFEQVKQELEKLVIERPGRKFRFADDDE